MESDIYNPGADIDMTFEFGNEFRVDTPLIYDPCKFLITCALNMKTFFRTY